MSIVPGTRRLTAGGFMRSPSGPELSATVRMRAGQPGSCVMQPQLKGLESLFWAHNRARLKELTSFRLERDLQSLEILKEVTSLCGVKKNEISRDFPGSNGRKDGRVCLSPDCVPKFLRSGEGN